MKKALIGLLESIADRELRRSEVEQIDSLMAGLKEETTEVVDYIVGGIDGIEFDDEDGYQVQASSHSH